MTILPRLQPFRISATLCLTLAIGSLALAEAPRALPKGELPKDARLGPLKDLDGYFPFSPPASKEAWERRADEVRLQMLVALGLWPLPARTPLNAVVHSPLEKDEYIVEKVYFESFPGFYVTGNLYRPKGKEGKLPGVLCPHGHWANGRFYDAGEAAAKRDVQSGAEADLEAARGPLQARCVQLARMGCVVFHYDMMGYADSVQISSAVAHGFAKQRPEMNSKEAWGLFSPQAESQLQSVMGMQTWASIRALDFLTSLSEVDSDRIAVTGASGGGTQTFILAAIDDRVDLAFPAVMVSTAMQGGCTCENCSLLRVGTGNIEFAALFAPKPQGMTAADDWTREMQTKGFPELQALYALLGAEDKVMLFSATQFPHNYNYVSRRALYNWINTHFKLELKEPVEEKPFDRLTTEQMTVWNAEHPKPESNPEVERRTLKAWHEDSQQQLSALLPTDEKSLEKYREVVGGGINVVVGGEAPSSNSLEYEQTVKNDRGEWLETGGLVRNKTSGAELPAVFLYPKMWNGKVVLWLSAEGKTGLFNDSGAPRSSIKRLIDNGVAVAGVDLLYQGEFLSDGKPLSQTPRVKNPREAAAYTFGYNRAVAAERSRDVLTMLAYIRGQERKPQAVHLAGLGEAGHWAAMARSQAGDAVDRTAIDTRGFRFIDVRDLHDPNFLPGGAKYFDLPGMLSLAAPGKLWLAGEGEKAPAPILASYDASGAVNNLTISADEEKVEEAAVDWLLE